MRHAVLGCLLAALALGTAADAVAHCQIPCGIYTDEMRFHMIEEHLTTIEKSMKQIGETAGNPNQQVRWVGNKEQHAQEIQDIVHAYFLTQRIKPVEAGADGHGDYVKSLELLHGMLVHAMKCKQTVDTAHVAKLRELLGVFHDHYFGDEEHGHHD